ncbi:MAG: T9SS type B sorting domain-containing protein [Bacteroidota bacterium]
MIQRVIPICLLLLSTGVLMAQSPEVLNNRWPIPTPNGRSLLTCGAGETPDAGSARPQIHPDAQSSSVRFLCLGDSLDIIHDGLFNFSGDPDMSTQAGIGYVFYTCPPTVTGPELADVLNDPCLLNNPPATIFRPTAPNIYIFTDPTNFDGNTTFWNTPSIEFPPGSGNILTLQQVFNMGDPFELWYAPITIDDHFTNMFENNGPCLDVNTDDAFSVVYLNEITTTPVTLVSNGGDCVGRFEIRGGLPEFDNSFYDLSITLDSDPSVVGEFDTPFTHESTVTFTVPQAGLYNISISDGVSCGASFQINMGSCQPVVFSMPATSCRPPTSNICLPVTVENFSVVASFEHSINWDPTALTYTGTNPGALLPPDLAINPNIAMGNMVVAYFNFADPSATLTFPDNTVLYEVCFDVVGPLNSVTDVSFSGMPREIILSGENGIVLAFDGEDATLSISSCNLDIRFASCSGRQDAGNPNLGTGSITVTAASGTGPFEINWEQDGNPSNNGNTTIPNAGQSVEIPNLPPGNYTITVIDDNGTQQVGSVTVADGDPLFVQLNPVNPRCAGGNDGKLFLNVAGGEPPYGIEWSTGITNIDSITGLAQGNYDVTVTDVNGCSVVAAEGVGVGAVTASLVSLVNVSCNGNGSDGSITIQGSGGTVNNNTDYTYLWDNGITSNSLSNLMPGNYCVTVTDLNGCTSGPQCFDVLDGDRPIITAWNIVNLQCSDDMNGSLTASVTPATAPIIEYSWTLPDNSVVTTTDPTLSNLGAGTYIFTALASDGCFVTETVEIMAPTPLSIDGVGLNSPTCPGDNDGSISVLVSGGTQPYTATWSTGAVINGTTLAGITGGQNYSVTIVDANQCDSITLDTILPNPPLINIFFDPNSVTMVSCNDPGTCDGQATVFASGGTSTLGLYDFQWGSNESVFGDTSSTASQLCQGWNTVTVSDGNCFNVDSVFIDAPPALQVDFDALVIQEPSCNDGDDGQITVAGTGGTPGYTYLWDTQETTPTISGLVAGSYALTIFDSRGCDFVTNINVQEPDILMVQIDTLLNVTCNDEDDGRIELNPTGGTLPYTYLWNNNVSTTNTAFELDPGNYSVTVVDARGCRDSLTASISEPPQIEFRLTQPEPPLCFGFQTILTVDSIWGGTPGIYGFSVENGPKRRPGASIPVTAGTYTVQIFDGNDCFVETIVEVSNPPQIVVSLGNDVEIQLGEVADLGAVVNPSTVVDSIFWAPLDTSTVCTSTVYPCDGIQVAPLQSTVYTVTVIDEKGCVGTDDILVEVDKNRNVYIPNIFTPNNDGRNDVFKPFIGAGVTRVNFFQVFDRWGALMYQQDNFVPNNNIDADGWDGSYKGKRLNPAVFVYLIEVEFVDGITLLYRGDITLLR